MFIRRQQVHQYVYFQVMDGDRMLRTLGKDPNPDVLRACDKYRDLIPMLLAKNGEAGLLVEYRRRLQLEPKPFKPIVQRMTYGEWLPLQPECDLLLTDPPYSSDVKDIDKFARDWLPLALLKVKPTGRAYVFTGAYPGELQAYLNIKPPEHLTLANVLVWTYRNTIGPSSKFNYNLNWQSILYYRGSQSAPLSCPSLTEQFAVQDFNAPDARFGERWHTWEKPMPLIQQLIEHSTNPGDLVLDCFAGTGTVLLGATQLGREARGCDISEEMIAIAEKRGCIYAR